MRVCFSSVCHLIVHGLLLDHGFTYADTEILFSVIYTVYNDIGECSCDLLSPVRHCMTHHQELAAVAAKIFTHSVCVKHYCV